MIHAITGDDTLVLKSRVITDLADGDVSAIAFPNDLVATKTGKNGNTIYARNETGRNGEMTLRLIRGSSDDKFFQSELSQIKQDLPKYVLIKGSFIKKIGDGTGKVVNDAYDLSGGVVKKPVDGKDNADGDTEQGVAIYVITFAKAERALG